MTRHLSRDLLAGLGAAVLLVGCGSGAEPSGAAASGAGASTSPSTAPCEGPVAEQPEVGEAALATGSWREGATLRSLLAEVQDPVAPEGSRRAAAGSRLVGLRVEQCVRSDAQSDESQEPPTTSAAADWSVVTPDGQQVDAAQTWTDWPAPRMPEYVELRPGQCEQGWLTVEVPDAVEVDRVRLSQGEPVAEWRAER